MPTLIEKLRDETNAEIVRTEIYLKDLYAFERSLYFDPKQARDQKDTAQAVAQELKRK